MNAKNKNTSVLAEECKISSPGGGIKQVIHNGADGDAEITVYPVFPGVTLLYGAVHTNKLDLSAKDAGARIEIHYCTEGRLERRAGDDRFFLSANDLSVSIRSLPDSNYIFPLRHYHGISVLIDVQTAPRCFSCFLQDVDLTPLQIVKRLCGSSDRFILHSDRRFCRVFDELNIRPGALDKGYIKIKILEILYLLSMTDPHENKFKTSLLPRSQVLLAKRAAAFLEANMDRVVSLAELSRECGASQTYLQTSVKAVYGTTAASYVRVLKMQKAASELINSEKSVIHIGLDLGYENASKFSAAFARIMGETPSEYRKNHFVKK